MVTQVIYAFRLIEKKAMKERQNGAVGKLSSEQKFCELNVL